MTEFKMPFGSYKGKTLEQIYDTDPSYVAWMRDDLNGFVQQAAIDFLKQKNMEIIKNGKPKTNNR